MAITVGLAGITGKFGRLLASKLIQNSDVVLRGYCRDPSKVITPLASSSQVSLWQGGAYDKEKIQEFVKGCDVVICAYLGDDKLMVDGQKQLIDACEVEGVPRYIASDWALDYTKLEFGELFPKDPMKHVKAYLDTQKSVKGVHILIGGFMDPIFSPFFQVFDPATNTFRYWGEGTEPWEGTSYENAAEYTAAVATDPSAIGIQKFLGDRKTIKEIAASFKEVYGIEPKLERLGSLDELKTRMHSLRQENPADIFKYMSLFFLYYWINGQTFVGPDVQNDKYPEVKPVTWEAFMKNRTVQELAGAYYSLSS
ncbi:NmrA-like family protein [Colletotrichum truncatum]|uniref:NmrA-like family protein n=1 Tax=Colletotrichum truncatum TaxID=5467 RepID=A0ACC3Z6C6_COLTU|nr:NmrA-like family protein [Colletotrichum truncatum]KAF6788077.1 NmrA-like family protein [Colletotrichum truncatum]